MDRDRPNVKFLDRSPPEITDQALGELAHVEWGWRDVEMRRLHSERDVSVLVEGCPGQVGVMKVSNASEDPAVVDLQIEALRWIEENGDVPTPRHIPTRGGAAVAAWVGGDGSPHLVRMVSFLPGVPLDEEPGLVTPRLMNHIGATMARLDRALAGFFHPAARNEHPWDITRCAALIPFTRYIRDAGTRRNVERVLERMSDVVLPGLRSLRHQVIHQDGHMGNLLIDRERPGEVAGIIDFGDMVHGPLVAEVAAAADTLLAGHDPMEVMAEVAAGFDEVVPLQPDEIDVLPDLVLARLAGSVTIGAARAALHPDLPAYIANDNELPSHMELLLGLGGRAMQGRLRARTHFPPPSPRDLFGATAPQLESRQQLERRRATMGASPHFYDEPLQLERGSGVWLYGRDGRSYLDFYNNVPVVGHCHPQVVGAIARQAAALNTNTRYLFTPVLDYAERLLDSLPDHLDVCLFVNSGSEANDVALQMATTETGRRGFLTMEDAYHGMTGLTAEVSPAAWVGERPGHVLALDRPDPYRGRLRSGEPDLSNGYAAEADGAITELAGRGSPVAAFIVDPAMCSSGLPDVPAGYLRAVESKVHGAGGLVIADEVQSGLGRLGEMWGHLAHGVRADIVTLGKPVGNGHPLGVVITSRAVLDRFFSVNPLFSTFGGNPVSCAAGLAVIDVIEREGLVEHSARVGEHLRSSVRELVGRRALIGDVRGRGALTGIELVRDREGRLPAPGETARILELLRENGIVAGSDGPDHNVLKLRPPLVLTDAHADRFVEVLDECLATIRARPDM